MIDLLTPSVMLADTVGTLQLILRIASAPTDKKFGDREKMGTIAILAGEALDRCEAKRKEIGTEETK